MFLATFALCSREVTFVKVCLKLVARSKFPFPIPGCQFPVPGSRFSVPVGSIVSLSFVSSSCHFQLSIVFLFVVFFFSFAFLCVVRLRLMRLLLLFDFLKGVFSLCIMIIMRKFSEELNR